VVDEVNKHSKWKNISVLEQHPLDISHLGPLRRVELTNHEMERERERKKERE